MKPLQGVRIVSVEQFGADLTRPCCLPTLAPRSSRSRTLQSAAIRRGRPAFSCSVPTTARAQAFNINKKSVSIDLAHR